MTTAEFDYSWLGDYPKENGDFMAVVLSDDGQSGKIYNVDALTIFNKFVCEKLAG